MNNRVFVLFDRAYTHEAMRLHGIARYGNICTRQSSCSFRLVTYFIICIFQTFGLIFFTLCLFLVVHQAQEWVSDKDIGSWTHQLTAGVSLCDYVHSSQNRRDKERKAGRRGAFYRPTISLRWSRGSVPPFSAINGKWIRRLLCFTCCKVTPKNTKRLSNSCSSLNYLTRYYITPTGCVPDGVWLPANWLSVCFFVLFL